jgi:hypothetical protein
MTEIELIQEIARRAELTIEAATRAYKAMQAIVPVNNGNKSSYKPVEALARNTASVSTQRVRMVA